MKVFVVIVAAFMLASAHASDVKCEKLCSGGASSCMTKNEAVGCQKTYRLSSQNSCYQCGSDTGAVKAGKDASNTAIGGSAGGGKWWKPWNAGTCNTCVSNCEVCASESTCTTCKTGYRLKSATECEACTVSNCANCQTTVSVCQACNTGFGPKAGACVACTGNCKSCHIAAPKCDTGKCDENFARATGPANDGNCFSCAKSVKTTDECTKAVTWPATGTDGLFLDLTAGTCTNCVTNCATCATQLTCNQCKSGFTFKSADSKTCSQCTVAGCATCNVNAAKCEACTGGQGYNLSANKDKCFKCVAPATATLALSGVCTPCTVANCKLCNAGSGTVCNVGQGCISGFVLDANVCQPCINNCATCAINQSKKAGNVAANMKCNGGPLVANNCKAGYYPDQTPGAATINMSCIKCGENCKVCANQYQCTTCEDGFQMDTQKKCTACKGNVCDAGKVKSGALAQSKYHNTRWQTSTGRTCVACLSGCKVVGGATQNVWDGTCKCTNCASNFWPWNGATFGVAQNTVLSATTGKCQTCGANCLLCGSKDQCAANSCASTYSNLNALGVCQKCSVANCLSCKAALNVCTLCAAGYKARTGGASCYTCPTGPVFDSPAAGTCVSCPAGCSGCSSATACTGCNAGYVTGATAGTCEKCGIANCGACLQATKNAKCTTCMGGYTPKTDGTACYKCDATQAVYSDPASGTCKSCGVSNCKSCAAANTCNACNSGFVLEAGKCHACGVKNCHSCAFLTRATTCTACVGKYAKQNLAKVTAGGQTNNCDASCDQHATVCGDAYTALTCDTKKNYYLAAGRCVYCNLKMSATPAGQFAAAGKPTTAGNQYLNANGVCGTCDSDADGCASTTAPNKCKSATNEVVGGNCVAKCKAYEAFATFSGKCNNGCVSNVAGSGTVNGGALNGMLGGCYGSEGKEAQLCSKGHHVQGAAIGLCCNDDNAASGLVVGSVTLASVMAALYALM